MGKIHKNGFSSIIIKCEISWNEMFMVYVKPRYEYTELILTLKKKIEESRCIWNILYWMPFSIFFTVYIDVLKINDCSVGYVE